jgi:4'-phosphopantetheinyl transferase
MANTFSAIRHALRWQLAAPAIGRGAVHVWCGRLSDLERHATSLTSVLCAPERERAASYKIAAHQLRYRLVRGTLRYLLGSYLDRDYAGISIMAGAQGKPRLSDPGAPLHFNVSHSGDLAAFAFCTASEVGVDVECIDAPVDTDIVARTAFSARELACYEEVSGEARRQRFFSLWTRKEARLKAAGLAVAHRYFPLAEDAAVVDLVLGNAYIGAVALRGTRRSEPVA